MRQHPPAGRIIRIELAVTEYDMPAHSKRGQSQITRRSGGRASGVYADAVERMVEAPLHEMAQRSIEGPARSGTNSASAGCKADPSRVQLCGNFRGARFDLEATGITRVA
jgi:hypothetical protein